MADFEDNGINVDDWMNQQPVSCIDCFSAGCSSKNIRRQYARQALFKRLTVEELERRYQKHKSRLRPEEDQAVRQAIDIFKEGWYVAIGAFDWIGTFYSPVSPLFTLFFILVREAIKVLMPFTYSFCKQLCRKEISTFCTICMLPLFPVCFVRELLRLIIYVLCLLVLLLLAIPVELLVFLGGMCYYRLGRLQKCGMFVYSCKLSFLYKKGHGTNKTYGNFSCDEAKLVLHHASLCQTTFCNPFTAVFKNIRRNEYSYGDIQGLRLSAQEVEMYQQQGPTLPLHATCLA